jgi:hypothetical protein
MYQLLGSETDIPVDVLYSGQHPGNGGRHQAYRLVLLGFFRLGSRGFVHPGDSPCGRLRVLSDVAHRHPIFWVYHRY